MNKKILSIIVAAFLVFSFTVSCKKQPAAETAAKAEGANAEETKAEEEKELPPPTKKEIGYAFGVMMGTSLKDFKLEVDYGELVKGLKDAEKKTDVDVIAAQKVLQRASEEAHKKGLDKHFDFYQRFESVAKDIISTEKGMDICSNVDYYSGFCYHMLDIPRDLYTPLFVVSRLVGWLAHNLENKLYDGRIMRPATKYVGDLLPYICREER